MKLAIIGSRTIKDLDLSPYITPEVREIVTGGASGVDALAEAYADKHRLSKRIIRPQYRRYAKAAPILRNQEIIAYADKVLVFWDGVSKGTKSSLAYLEKHAVPYELVMMTSCSMLSK